MDMYLLCILSTSGCIEASSFNADKNTLNVLGSVCIFPKTAVNKVLMFRNGGRAAIFTLCNNVESMMLLANSRVARGRGSWMAVTSLS